MADLIVASGQVPRWSGLRVLVAVSVMAASLGAVGACAHLPPPARANVRQARYLSTHPETPLAIRDAIARGHVTSGMDRDQVRAALGEPGRRTTFGGDTPVEVWLYQGHALHYGAHDPLRGHRSSLFRLVFQEGILAFVEPLS